VVVENVPGRRRDRAHAPGEVRSRRPTIALGATTNLAVSPTQLQSFPTIPLKDFAPIALLARVPSCWCERAVPARSVASSSPRARASRQAQLRLDRPRVHRSPARRDDAADGGIDIVHCLQGRRAGRDGLARRERCNCFLPGVVDARALVRSGALRPLALVDSRRPVAPEPADARQLGYPPGSGGVVRSGSRRPGTPEAIVQAARRECGRVLSLEAMRRFLDEQGTCGRPGAGTLKAYHPLGARRLRPNGDARRACRSRINCFEWVSQSKAESERLREWPLARRRQQ